MTTIETRYQSARLPSVYDEGVFSEEQFLIERDRVHSETAIERKWMDEAEITPYETDADILADAEIGKLQRVSQGAGYLAIARLMHWEPERSDPQHPWHYSVPYLRPEAFEVLTRLGMDWQSDMGTSRALSVTSLGRSSTYQSGLRQQYRKLTIANDDDRSSHEGLIAFDIDGCGLKEMTDWGESRSINPRSSDWSPTLVQEGRSVLRHLLDNEVRKGRINYVEELAGTQEHCFHVCVNPTA